MRPSRSIAVSCLAFAVILLGLSREALATQFVIAEVTYEHSATSTTDSHYRVMPAAGTPANWLTPIDYAGSGTAVVRLEVFTKPSAARTRYQICFEATPSYACTDQAPIYTTTGVYTWTTPFTRFYQYSAVDWTRGVRTVALILKDDMNRKPSPENVGPVVSAMYMPTRLRVTVTIVSAGSTYVPPDAMIDGGIVPTDSGTRFDAGRDDVMAPGFDSARDERDDVVVPAADDATGRSDVIAEVRTDVTSDSPGIDAGNGGGSGGCGCSAIGLANERVPAVAIGWAAIAAAWIARRRSRSRA